MTFLLFSFIFLLEFTNLSNSSIQLLNCHLGILINSSYQEKKSLDSIVITFLLFKINCSKKIGLFGSLIIILIFPIICLPSYPKFWANVRV